MTNGMQRWKGLTSSLIATMLPADAGVSQVIGAAVFRDPKSPNMVAVAEAATAMRRIITAICWVGALTGLTAAFTAGLIVLSAALTPF